MNACAYFHMLLFLCCNRINNPQCIFPFPHQGCWSVNPSPCCLSSPSDRKWLFLFSLVASTLPAVCNYQNPIFQGCHFFVLHLLWLLIAFIAISATTNLHLWIVCMHEQTTLHTANCPTYCNAHICTSTQGPYSPM